MTKRKTPATPTPDAPPAPDPNPAAPPPDPTPPPTVELAPGATVQAAPPVDPPAPDPVVPDEPETGAPGANDAPLVDDDEPVVELEPAVGVFVGYGISGFQTGDAAWLVDEDTGCISGPA